MDRLTELAYELIEKHGVDRYPTVTLNALKLFEEAGEVAGSILKQEPTERIAEEIADLEICLRLLASKLNVNIDEAVRHKVETETRSFV